MKLTKNFGQGDEYRLDFQIYGSGINKFDVNSENTF